ncbi:hypothetical protein ES703_54497 [subsurface metagenome]
MYNRGPLHKVRCVIIMTIDVGISGSKSGWTNAYTIVNGDNPANATGIIAHIAIYAHGTCTNVKVASFTQGAANVLTTRGNTSLANLSAGKNEFSVTNGDFIPFEIRTGDFIGAYVEGGSSDGIDAGSGASTGYWRKSGDYIPCTSETFTWIAGTFVSVYAEGYQLGQINIGDAWKDIQNIQINIGDSWKQITLGSGINIGDVWKNILH